MTGKLRPENALVSATASLWCDLGSLSPDEGNEVLIDEEDKSQAGNLGRRERWLSLEEGQSHIPVCQAAGETPSSTLDSPPPQSCC